MVNVLQVVMLVTTTMEAINAWLVTQLVRPVLVLVLLHVSHVLMVSTSLVLLKHVKVSVLAQSTGTQLIPFVKPVILLLVVVPHVHHLMAQLQIWYVLNVPVSFWPLTLKLVWILVIVVPVITKILLLLVTRNAKPVVPTLV